jgi:hypothetical protein
MTFSFCKTAAGFANIRQGARVAWRPAAFDDEQERLTPELPVTAKEASQWS